MIVYKNIIERLTNAGYPWSVIKREKILSGSTMVHLKNGEPVSTETINKLCSLLSCQPGDLLEYVPDKQPWSPPTLEVLSPDELDSELLYKLKSTFEPYLQEKSEKE